MFKKMIERWLRKHTYVNAYLGNPADSIFIADVYMFGLYVARVKIHPRADFAGRDICGDVVCPGIHKTKL